MKNGYGTIAAGLGVAFVLVLLGLVGRWDYEDQVEERSAPAERAAELCLPHARGDTTVVSWLGTGELVCTYHVAGGATRSAVFQAGVWTPL